VPTVRGLLWFGKGDPCEHLVVSDNEDCHCGIYENRFGIHKTRGGDILKCVPINTILHKSWPGDHGCGYKQSSRED